MTTSFENRTPLAASRYALVTIFLVSLILMLATTVVASWQTPIWSVDPQVLGDRWFQATLLDAYLGFLTFYVWVAYKESSIGSRILWFVLIMCLGNIAMAGYMLLQLGRWNVADGIAGLLLRRPDSSSGD